VTGTEPPDDAGRATPAGRAGGDLAAIEAALTADLETLGGILAASVSLSEPARIHELVIATANDASLAAVGATVARLLRDRGLQYDRGAVQIGAVPDPPLRTTKEEATPARRFLLLQDIDVQRTGDHVVCRVRIVRGETTFTGQARELDTELGRARAAARATLRAAEYAGQRGSFALEGTAFADFFGRRYVVVLVEAAADRMIRRLSGIVAIDRSAEEAAVLAALGAIERWISA
jgi:hypothetical protein